MPAYNAPYSLRSLSLFSIAKYITKICQQFHTFGPSKYKREDRITAVENYVLSIPDIFAIEYNHIIINLFSYSNNELFLSIAMHPNCTAIDVGDTEDLYYIVCPLMRCLGSLRNLKRLVLDLRDCGLPDFSNDEDIFSLAALAESFVNLGNLTVIRLPKLCTLQMLRCITDNCPLLEDLDIDNPILLAGNLRCLKKCRNLLKLSCEGNDDFEPDIVYLLHKLPKLKSLCWFDISVALRLLQDYPQRKKPYLLEHAFILNCVNTDMANLCKTFPNLKTVQTTKAVGHEIVNIKNLENANSFILVEENVNDLVEIFEGKSNNFITLSFVNITDLNQLLAVNEFHSLQEIFLYGCADIDLCVLNSSVPNLTSLFLRSCTAVPMKTASTLGFRNLDSLRINGLFSKEHLCYLLSSCFAITRLSLGQIKWHDALHSITDYVVTDSLWLKITRENEFKELKEISICSNAITRTVTLKYLLEQCANLECLSFQGNHWHNELTQSQQMAAFTSYISSFQICVQIDSDGLQYYMNNRYPIDRNPKMLKMWKV